MMRNIAVVFLICHWFNANGQKSDVKIYRLEELLNANPDVQEILQLIGRRY